MAFDRGILAQVCPTTTADTLLYASPRNGVAGISTVFVCNQTGGALTFRLRATLLGEETAAVKQYLYYNTSVAANDTIAITCGLSLADGEALYCLASAANSISFVLFGGESQ